MAENKKSFILYSDLIHTVSKLPNDKAGELFKHILAYVNDENPVSEDLIIQIAFEPIKLQLKRDLKKWENYIEKQSENGKKGGRPPKSEETQITQPFLGEPKKADTVTVNDTVTDTVKEIQNNTLKGERHFQHIKEFFSADYETQFKDFKERFTQKEYTLFQKFLDGMFRDFTIEQLTANFDKCLGIGDWKQILQCKGFLIIKPALEKAIAAKEGNREQMALRIKTFTNGLLDEKVFSK